MTIVDKIKNSIEAATDVMLHYQSPEMLNTLLDGVNYPCAYLYLLQNEQLNIDGNHLRERLQIAVFFVEPTQFDFESFENEKIIDRCKGLAFKWLHSLSTDKHLRLLGVNGTQRVYNEADAILTGFAVNVTIEELQGDWVCVEIPYNTLHIYITSTAIQPVKSQVGTVPEYLTVTT